MKRHNTLKHSCAVSRSFRAAFLGMAVAMLAGSGQALGADSDSWEWRATVYGWLPTLEGKSRLPSGASGPSIQVDPDDLLDNLDFTFMGALSVKKGVWGAFTDVIFLDESASKSGSRDFTIGGRGLPADVSLDADYDLESWVWTLAGTYSLSDSEHNPVDLLLGTRLFDIEQKLKWTVNGSLSGLDLPGRSGRASVSEANWDAIVGIKGFASLGASGRWFVPYHVDIGTGDSDFTWQAMAGVAYQFDWGAVMLNYRYLDYELDSEATVSELSLGGPMLGASFTW